MPTIRRIIGHVNVEVAKGKRKCYRKPKTHVITKGEACLVIANPSSDGSKNYCSTCAIEILDQAQEDLEHLRAMFVSA